jgi:ankyrin repeat domain-containing protein 50
VYCRYTEPLKVRDILAALVRQLLERFPGLLALVEPLYAKHDLERTKPTQSELINVIRNIYSCFRLGYLFIDGLDEAMYDEQFDLLDTLKSVRANVFITSRPLVQLEDILPNMEFFDIAARQEDIERLVSEHLSRNPNLRRLLSANGQWQAVSKKICESACGM